MSESDLYVVTRIFKKIKKKKWCWDHERLTPCWFVYKGKRNISPSYTFNYYIWELLLFWEPVRKYETVKDVSKTKYISKASSVIMMTYTLVAWKEMFDMKPSSWWH